MNSTTNKILSTRPQATFQFFYIGLILSALGVFLMVKTWVILGFPLFFIGAFTLLTITGVEIDLAKREYRVYYNFLFMKFGVWKSLDGYTHVILSPYRSTTEFNVRSVSTNIITRSFTIYLYGLENEPLELMEFTELKKAEAYLEMIAAETGLEAIDKQEIMTNLAFKRRRFRR
jgi:hypothetical protein